MFPPKNKQNKEDTTTGLNLLLDIFDVKHHMKSTNKTYVTAEACAAIVYVDSRQHAVAVFVASARSDLHIPSFLLHPSDCKPTGKIWKAVTYGPWFVITIWRIIITLFYALYQSPKMHLSSIHFLLLSFIVIPRNRTKII